MPHYAAVAAHTACHTPAPRNGNILTRTRTPGPRIVPPGRLFGGCGAFWTDVQQRTWEAERRSSC
jgi:hypothetical protein